MEGGRLNGELVIHIHRVFSKYYFLCRQHRRKVRTFLHFYTPTVENPKISPVVCRNSNTTQKSGEVRISKTMELVPVGKRCRHLSSLSSKSEVLSPTRFLLSRKKVTYKAFTFASLISTAMAAAFSTKIPSSSSTSTLSHPLVNIARTLDYSWVNQLSPEDTGVIPTNPATNNKSRRVKNGHYVLVNPKPLKNPRMIAYSRDLAAKLSLTEEEVASDEFKRFFSGDIKAILPAILDSGSSNPRINTKESGVYTWATPYALSIMGTRYTSNCPFGTGEGYGDGRAISIAEISIESDSGSKKNRNVLEGKMEFQLKGAGPTPFCRGADGRAVLRSSIREFLASEAMHFLNIDTTRALSLIVSEGADGDTSKRPWYQEAFSNNTSSVSLPDIDDPRLAMYSLEQRKLILQQMARQKRDPDVMIEEPNAITCRVSPSFVRIGHLDLFSRRVVKTLDPKTNMYDTKSREWKELEDIIWHACYRDLPSEISDQYRETGDLQGCADELLKFSAERLAVLVSNWIRVGFCQGNFNADNCLVAGRTMDYGPFGWMDEYSRLFSKWTGSGEHFGFMNQPSAGLTNFMVLVESILPILSTDGRNPNNYGYDVDGDHGHELKEKYLGHAQKLFQNELDKVFMSKMGFDLDVVVAEIDKMSMSTDGKTEMETDDVIDLWYEVESLMRRSRTDWTLTWRQLYYTINEFPIPSDDDDSTVDYEAVFEFFNGNEVDREGSSPFYGELDPTLRSKWIAWLRKWREALISHAKELPESSISVEERMRTTNPKYVLREWMLVQAYFNSASDDDSKVHELLNLIEHPYDEGSESESERFYRRAPEDALQKGGTAFMS